MRDAKDDKTPTFSASQVEAMELGLLAAKSPHILANYLWLMDGDSGEVIYQANSEDKPLGPIMAIEITPDGWATISLPEETPNEEP